MVPLVITEIARDLNLSPISEYIWSQTLHVASARSTSYDDFPSADLIGVQWGLDIEEIHAVLWAHEAHHACIQSN
jgi:hypothetical protein